MIVTCINCVKRFEIDSSLITDSGRLLKCSSCNHEWFFKKDLVIENSTPEVIEPIKNDISETVELLDKVVKKDLVTENSTPEVIEPIKNDISETIELLDKVVKKDIVKEKVSIMPKDKKNYNILGLTIVFIISFIALIIVVDTFQNFVSGIVPDIEFLLYNLYETINDIVLFIKDLI